MVYRGTLPPQLLLEVLQSTNLLLCSRDCNSVRFLKDYCRTSGHDPGNRFQDVYVTRQKEYKYFGDRLSTLLDTVQAARPTNPIDEYFKEHKFEKVALMLTAASLILTALFGLISMSGPLTSCIATTVDHTIGSITSSIAVYYSVKQYQVAMAGLGAQTSSSATSSL